MKISLHAMALLTALALSGTACAIAAPGDAAPIAAISRSVLTPLPSQTPRAETQAFSTLPKAIWISAFMLHDNAGVILTDIHGHIIGRSIPADKSELLRHDHSVGGTPLIPKIVWL